MSVIEAFRRTWPHALEEAPRFTNIALAVLLVLIQTGQSLVEMPLVLTNQEYREHLLEQVRDPELIQFFHDRFDRWGRETAVMTESVLNKVTAFSFNPLPAGTSWALRKIGWTSEGLWMKGIRS